MASTSTTSAPVKSKPNPPTGTNGAAKKTRSNTPIPSYDFGKTIEEAIDRFDGVEAHQKVVFACFVAGAKQQWAEHLRKIEANLGSPPGEAVIDHERAIWRPSVKRRGMHAHEKASRIIGKLSADERAALLNALQA